MCLQWWHVLSIFDFPQHYQYLFQDKKIILKTFSTFRFVFIIYTTQNNEHIEYHIIFFCCDVWEGLTVLFIKNVIYAIFVFRHFVSLQYTLKYWNRY